MPIWVVFEVKCPTVNLEDVRVVGSVPELGSWEPSRALPLVSTERTYPSWRSVEIALPSQGAEVVQYKYIKVFDGSLVQWEAGPNRFLDLSCLLERMVNYVDDLTFDLKDNVPRRSGNRIRFQETFKSAVTSVTTSRFASSVPSPLRASQTPVEKTPSCSEELDNILRELTELQHMNLSSRPELRRAVQAVQAAIEVERSGGRRKEHRPVTCAMVALLMVPLMPLLVTALLVAQLQPARARYNSFMALATEAFKRPLRRLLEPDCGSRAGMVPWMQSSARGSLAMRADRCLPSSRRRLR
mmetsp:Transcript_66860/g.159551  ORF Transcript_66860/g.159551 Transcript_66860/m.159551 type:complete len:299 (-) Transcript_66860:125-1021(-)